MIAHNGQNAAVPLEERIRLLDFVAVLLRRWKTVVAVVVVAVLVAAVVERMRPDLYVSQTTMIPAPSESDMLAQNVAGQLPTALAARMMGGTSSSQAMLAAIVRSHSLRDTLARRVAAEEGAGEVTEAEVRGILWRSTTVTHSAKDGSITVDVGAPDPHLAARIAGAFPDVINELATRIVVSSAQGKREVLERQLVDARERLVQSEQRLLAFQEKRGAPDVSEQAKQTLQAAADLQQRLSEKELEVAQLRRTVTPEHPLLRAAEAELQTRRGQLRRLTSGARSSSEGLLAQRELPELRVEANRLMREATTDEQVYLGLTAALLGTQMDLKNNLALVSVLDPATVPQFPSGSPVRTLIMAVLVGFVFGVVLAFVREYAAHVQRDPESEPFRAALTDFKSDLTRLLPHRRYRGRVMARK